MENEKSTPLLDSLVVMAAARVASASRPRLTVVALVEFVGNTSRHRGNRPSTSRAVTTVDPMVQTSVFVLASSSTSSSPPASLAISASILATRCGINVSESSTARSCSASAIVSRRPSVATTETLSPLTSTITPPSAYRLLSRSQASTTACTKPANWSAGSLIRLVAFSAVMVGNSAGSSVGNVQEPRLVDSTQLVSCGVMVISSSRHSVRIDQTRANGSKSAGPSNGTAAVTCTSRSVPTTWPPEISTLRRIGRGVRSVTALFTIENAALSAATLNTMPLRFLVVVPM